MGFAGTAELGRELANQINAGALGTLLAGGTGGAAGGVADLGELALKFLFKGAAKMAGSVTGEVEFGIDVGLCEDQRTGHPTGEPPEE